MKIVAEDKVVEQKTQELLQDWEKGKPVKVSAANRLYSVAIGNHVCQLTVCIWSAYSYCKARLCFATKLLVVMKSVCV
jgi:hypothetical protein